jgi:hypothetical protein
MSQHHNILNSFTPLTTWQILTEERDESSRSASNQSAIACATRCDLGSATWLQSSLHCVLWHLVSWCVLMCLVSCKLFPCLSLSDKVSPVYLRLGGKNIQTNPLSIVQIDSFEVQLSLSQLFQETCLRPVAAWRRSSMAWNQQGLQSSLLCWEDSFVCQMTWCSDWWPGDHTVGNVKTVKSTLMFCSLLILLLCWCFLTLWKCSLEAALGLTRYTVQAWASEFASPVWRLAERLVVLNRDE